MTENVLIDKAISLVKSTTGIVVDKRIFGRATNDKYSYYLSGKIYLLSDQPIYVILHEIGHYVFDILGLEKWKRYKEVFKGKAQYKGKKFYNPSVHIVIDASVSPEEDFCSVFAEILRGATTGARYSRKVRNKIRRVESILNQIKKDNQ